MRKFPWVSDKPLIVSSITKLQTPDSSYWKKVENLESESLCTNFDVTLVVHVFLKVLCDSKTVTQKLLL